MIWVAELYDGVATMLVIWCLLATFGLQQGVTALISLPGSPASKASTASPKPQQWLDYVELYASHGGRPPAARPGAAPTNPDALGGAGAPT